MSQLECIFELSLALVFSIFSVWRTEKGSVGVKLPLNEMTEEHECHGYKKFGTNWKESSSEKKLYTNKEQWIRKRRYFRYMSLVEFSAHQLQVSAQMRCRSGRNNNFVIW
jgi:hypothetical protein